MRVKIALVTHDSSAGQPHDPVVDAYRRSVDLTLIRAKRAAGRPKDLEVIAELEAIRDESGAP